MTRADTVKKCVERGVAAEAEADVVADLLYIFLLSALQRGQSVEVPHFGSFGTRFAGAKRPRKVPLFDPDPDLANLANARFRDLRQIVVATYNAVPVEAVREAATPLSRGGGEEPAAGIRTVIDTTHGLEIEEYDRSLETQTSLKPSKEDQAMPRLNLKDDSLEGDTGSLDSDKIAAPPTLRDVGGGGGGGRTSPLLLVLLIIVALGAGLFALNYFKVIHLWGKRAPKVAEVLPEPSPTPETELGPSTDQGVAPSGEQSAEQIPEPSTLPETTPTPTPTTTAPTKTTPSATTPTTTSPTPTRATPPKPSISTSGTGDFTVQVSSWMNRAKADEEASKLTSAGYTAFVEDATVGGESWHRVRVGHYSTQQDAQEAAAQLQKMMEGVVWVAKVGK